MKKIISVCLVLLSVFSIFSINTYAQESTIEPVSISKNAIIGEVYGLYNTDSNTDISLMATELIVGKNLKLSKTTDKLLINAKTSGSSDVTKCGFTYIKLQRLINGSWTDYRALSIKVCKLLKKSENNVLSAFGVERSGTEEADKNSVRLSAHIFRYGL